MTYAVAIIMAMMANGEPARAILPDVPRLSLPSWMQGESRADRRRRMKLRRSA